MFQNHSSYMCVVYVYDNKTWLHHIARMVYYTVIVWERCKRYTSMHKEKNGSLDKV